MTHMLGRASQRPGWRGGWGKKKKKKRVSVTGDKIREQRLLVWTLNPEQMTSCLKVLWAIFYLVAFHIICTFMLRWWPAICQNRTWYTESGSEIRCLPWVGCCVIGSFFFLLMFVHPKWWALLKWQKQWDDCREKAVRLQALLLSLTYYVLWQCVANYALEIQNKVPFPRPVKLRFKARWAVNQCWSLIGRAHS